MSRRAAGFARFFVAIGAIVAAATAGVPARPSQQATFRSSTDAVWVMASAFDRDGRLVTDLRKSDFEVFDHGVPRDITVFRDDPMPFALAIMLDVSESMTPNLILMRRGVQQLVSEFRPGDRATVGTFAGKPFISPSFTANPGTLATWITATIGNAAVPCEREDLGPPAFRPGPASSVTKGVPQGPGISSSAFGQQATNVGTALWDGLYCGVHAVAADAETPRRVALVITDGKENVSAHTLADVTRLADDYGVMIYCIGMFGEEAVDASALHGLANETGGGFFLLRHGDDLVATFARVADELRHQYVFGVSLPAGDTGGGLEVRVKRPDVQTHARLARLESATPLGRKAAANTAAPSTPTSLPAPVPNSSLSPPPASGGSPSSAPPRSSAKPDAASTAALEMALNDYELAGLPPFTGTGPTAETLANIRLGLAQVAPTWTAARGPGEEPRRRLVIAMFVLDLLTAVPDPILWKLEQPAAELQEWACGLLRRPTKSGAPMLPLPPERAWYLASLAVMERMSGSGGIGGNGITFSMGRAIPTQLTREALDRMLEHAVERFPDEPRWVLAHAISLELHTWPEARDQSLFLPGPVVVARLEDAYLRASNAPAVRQEALVRWAEFELRRRQFDKALEHLNAAGEPDDPVVRYWLHLIRGRTLEYLNRTRDAIVDYRLALQAVPMAQSATIALGAALLTDHRGPEASALVMDTLLLPPRDDPWRYFTFPDYRFLPAWLDEVRKAVRQ